MRRLLVAAVSAAAFAWPGLSLATPGPLALVPCGSRLCGTLTVPEDRADPGGRTIGVHVEVIPAEQPDRRVPEPFVPLAGGPGGAASSLGGFATSIFYDVWQSHDILLVDQRGTGQSNPIFCPIGSLIAIDSPPSWITNYWTACLAWHGIDPGLYTTSAAMQDLDDVRAALGYERLDLFGVSYGATAAQYYLLRFPDRVRSVVLDGGTALDIPIFERWAQNAQEMLTRLFARCAKDTDCRRAFPNPAKDLRTVLARLAKKPVRANRTTVTAERFAGAIQAMSRKPDTAAAIPLVLRRAASKGVAGVAARIGIGPGGTNTQLMYWATRCGEPWARFDSKRAASLGTGSYLAAADAQQLAFASSVCAAFPPFADVPGADRQVVSSVPALWIVGGEDPQDPLANVAGVTTSMPNAKVVVVRGGGHSSVDLGCVSQLANRFVLRGTAAGLATGCAAKTPYAYWVLR